MDERQLFERLMVILREKGFAYPDVVRPGLSVAEIEEELADLDLVIPSDVKNLFTVSNGIDVPESRHLPPGLHRHQRMLSLQECLKWYDFFRDSPNVPPSWFPLFTDSYSFYFVMTEEGDEKTAPLVDWDPECGDSGIGITGVREFLRLTYDLVDKGAFYPGADGEILVHEELCDAVHESYKQHIRLILPEYSDDLAATVDSRD